MLLRNKKKSKSNFEILTRHPHKPFLGHVGCYKNLDLISSAVLTFIYLKRGKSKKHFFLLIFLIIIFCMNEKKMTSCPFS